MFNETLYKEPTFWKKNIYLSYLYIDFFPRNMANVLLVQTSAFSIYTLPIELAMKYE